MVRVSSEYMQARRDRIARAAIDQFSFRGIHLTSMSNIIEASGLSAGTIYNHFKGKNEIIAYVARTTCSELFAEVDARIAPGPELEDYWIFHALRRVANFAINGGLVYERITRRGFFVMQLTDGPDELRGPGGRVAALLGAPSDLLAREQVWGALEVALVGVALLDPRQAEGLRDEGTREASWQALLEAGRGALGRNNALRMSGKAPRPAQE